MNNFASYQYAEIAVCLEDAVNSKYGKFYIPVLTPFLDNAEPYDKEDIFSIKNNIININDIRNDIKTCTVSNYIELKLPFGNDNIKKGDKFLVSFIGGDPNKPQLIRRCD